MDMQQLRFDGSEAASAAPSEPIGYTTVSSTDAAELTHGVRDWNFEFTQLSSGKFSASGAVLDLDGVSIARLSMGRTLLQRGHAPRGMFAVFIPGAGSGPAYVRGQLLETGQCVTLTEGAEVEAITHEGYLDVSFGVDLNACRAQLDALNGGSMGLSPGTLIAAPGPAWINDMLGRVDWLLAAVMEYAQCLGNDRVRARLADHALAAMVRFDNSPADVDATTRSARAARRVAVRIARDYIHSRLSEPLRLAELCRQAHLQIRSLEYGFREVTGLTPVAYIRSLRLNAVRSALQQTTSGPQRSISEIAMDVGFWHLSQFATDYRRFFGETPTATRRRAKNR
jgi:AraC family transcriptional regulator, ethanolamine operon transcriptional activator